jgi:CDGSH-type Zn-finger protein
LAESVIAQKAPFPLEVEAGKKYFWCACGKSANQPLCDGSHQGSDFLPLKYEAKQSTKLYFCGCKQTQGAPLCDGSHSDL